MKDFRKLKVWQKAHRLTLKVYEITRKFPPDELYGVTSQMRKSSSSDSYEHRRGLWSRQ